MARKRKGAALQAGSAAQVAEERAKICARIADEKKAEDIVILDLRSCNYVTDFFVIATGRNERQRTAIAAEVIRQMAQVGEQPLGATGERASQWILLDYVDFVIHIFSPEARALYDLELLWGDAPRLGWR